MRFIPTTTAALSLVGFAMAQGPQPFCFCPKNLVCSGTAPQCTPDTNGETICCASGQSAIQGKCVNAGSHLCSDGKTICSGANSQCTINVSVYVDKSGGAGGDTVCCAPGEKALNGACFPGNSKLMPCYQGAASTPCDWGNGYYCAWNTGNLDSKCCKFDEYLGGNVCAKKP